ncbi:MAG: hypothetical protein U9P42_10990 [Candidatus Fermentibacteria bacterium]|nr:hypothetical protein [Candidatus Fermentibacteria bacterium]
MEFFSEKNGKYYAAAGSGGKGGKSILTRMAGIVPLIVLGIYFYLNQPGKSENPINMTVIMAIGILIFSSLIAFFLKKAGLGAGITVDQMERKITYSRPGNQRKSISMDSIQKILLKTKAGKYAVLSLVSLDGSDHILSFSRDLNRMRRMADELSTLISVTVNEETM